MRPRIFYGWWVLLSSSSVVAIGFATAAYVLPVFYPELVETFQWSRTRVVFGGSIQLLLVGLIAPLNGWLIDRQGARRVLIAGLVTLCLAFALLSQVTTLWQYYLVCFAIGLGGSWVHHLPNQLLMSAWFVRRRGLAIGIMTTAAGFGASAIASIAARLIRDLGWQHAALAIPLFLLVPLALTLTLTRNNPREIGLMPDGVPASAETFRLTAEATPKTAARPEVPVRNLWNRPALWLIGLALSLGSAASFGVWQHLVSFLRANQVGVQSAALVYSAFLAWSTIGRFVCGPLSDRISPSAVLGGCYVLVGLGTLVLTMATEPMTMHAFAVVFGLGYGGSITVRPLVFFEHFGSAGVGKFYGVVTTLFSVGTFIGPLATAYLVDSFGSYRLAFRFTIATTALAACVAMSLVRARPRVAPVAVPG